MEAFMCMAPKECTPTAGPARPSIRQGSAGLPNGSMLWGNNDKVFKPGKACTKSPQQGKRLEKPIDRR
jgi:hypothetical protein